MATTRRSSTSSPAAAARTPAGDTPGPAAPATTKTFVLDTSVLLSDPRAMLRFHEHDVVLPVVVVTELEGKRHHPELGYFARQALRLLDDLRVSRGRLDAPVPIGEGGGTLHVELNHTDLLALPDGFRLGDNDSRILAVAKNLALEGRDVTLVSKDLPMRVKASAVGLDAEEYRAEITVDSRLDRHDRARRHRRGDGRPVRPGAGRARAGPRAALPHRGGAAQPARQRPGPGRRGQDRSAWSAATATRSGCTAAAPSSGSPSTCCSTPTSASSASVAAPAPARARSRCAPASRR